MLYPPAIKKLLPENQTQVAITPTQVILHTAVDAPGPSSLFPYFCRKDVGAESHFFVKLDGTVEQYMDTEVKANANRLADVRAISIETEDEGNPHERPWTQAQLVSIKALLEWIWQWHKLVPRKVCEAWFSPGVGYHSMWGAPSEWTLYAGKTCPGPLRIAQFKSFLVPWIENPQPERPRGEVEHMIVRNQENGACLHVSGGVSILIDNTEDLADFKRAGIPVVDVRPSQFRKYEKIRVDNV